VIPICESDHEIKLNSVKRATIRK